MKRSLQSLKTRALAYHRYPRPGKIEIVPTKPFATPEDLSLAYSPGVAYPCLEIAANPDNSFKYTGRGNTVAVISNGTAVLGLGNIGAAAAKPVMEGKALLFKIFAGLDAFDIEVDEQDPKKFIDIVKALVPTFGGVNLEDIKAPECFEIEKGLVDSCGIPVMHDDQHGTATIVAAGMENALLVQGKSIGDVKMVVNGAGAAAIACTKLLVAMGMKLENIVMCDSKGAIRADRPALSESKKQFATTRTDIHTLADAMRGADVFLGLSVANVVTAGMLASMAERPIVFALANPDPEISRELAMSVRKDLVFATGRSDYPNQINNVLGFPYIFRAALDCRATTINQEMKLAAAHAIAAMAREPADAALAELYSGETLDFGPEYILPKPFDRRLLRAVPPAIAEAAATSGVARKPVADLKAYGKRLEKYVADTDQIYRSMIERTAV